MLLLERCRALLLRPKRANRKTLETLTQKVSRSRADRAFVIAPDTEKFGEYPPTLAGAGSRGDVLLGKSGTRHAVEAPTKSTGSPSAKKQHTRNPLHAEFARY